MTEQMMVTKAEKELLEMRRKLAALQGIEVVVPPELLRWGTSSVRDVARFLALEVKEVARLVSTGALPTSTKGNVPNSEVLRRLKLQHHQRIGQMGRRIQQRAWTEPSLSILEDDGDEFRPLREHGQWRPGSMGYDFAGAAEALGISVAAVRRLVTVDRKLFAWGRPKAGWRITEEELVAYKHRAAHSEQQGAGVAA